MSQSLVPVARERDLAVGARREEIRCRRRASARPRCPQKRITSGGVPPKRGFLDARRARGLREMPSMTSFAAPPSRSPFALAAVAFEGAGARRRRGMAFADDRGTTAPILDELATTRRTKRPRGDRAARAGRARAGGADAGSRGRGARAARRRLGAGRGGRGEDLVRALDAERTADERRAGRRRTRVVGERERACSKRGSPGTGA